MAKIEVEHFTKDYGSGRGVFDIEMQQTFIVIFSARLMPLVIEHNISVAMVSSVVIRGKARLKNAKIVNLLLVKVIVLKELHTI